MLITVEQAIPYLLLYLVVSGVVNLVRKRTLSSVLDGAGLLIIGLLLHARYGNLLPLIRTALETPGAITQPPMDRPTLVLLGALCARNDRLLRWAFVVGPVLAVVAAGLQVLRDTHVLGPLRRPTLPPEATVFDVILTGCRPWRTRAVCGALAKINPYGLREPEALLASVPAPVVSGVSGREAQAAADALHAAGATVEIQASVG
jgi:ribosomal protein L7/L12